MIIALTGKRGEEADGRASIILHLNSKLHGMGLKFGLLHVRNGKDEVKDSGPLLNKELYFSAIDRRGTLQTVVAYRKDTGFQFKCFADMNGYDFEAVAQALKENGFVEISKGGGELSRVWFILPNYPQYTTIDKLVNNFYYPS